MSLPYRKCMLSLSHSWQPQAQTPTCLGWAKALPAQVPQLHLACESRSNALLIHAHGAGHAAWEHEFIAKKKQSWPKHNTDNDNAADNALILKTLPYHTMSVKKIPVQIQYIGWIKVYSDQSAQWQTWAFEDFETIVAKCPAPPFLKQGRLRFQRATSTKVFSLTPPFALVAGNSFSFAKANMYSIQNHWSISQGKIMQNKMNSNCYYINKKTSLK